MSVRELFGGALAAVWQGAEMMEPGLMEVERVILFGGTGLCVEMSSCDIWRWTAEDLDMCLAVVLLVAVAYLSVDGRHLTYIVDP